MQNPFKNLPLSLFGYGVVFALFHIAPAFLNFEIRDKLMFADLFDLATPLVLVFWVLLLIFFLDKNDTPRLSRAVRTLLFFGVLLFVEGHGMHLSANAIHRHLTPDMPAPLLRLTDFFDEQLGHILWDSGNISLTLAILLHHFRHTVPFKAGNYLLLIGGGTCYGFTYFVNAVEGQTVIFTLPYIALLFLILLELHRRRRWRISENGAPFFSPRPRWWRCFSS